MSCDTDHNCNKKEQTKKKRTRHIYQNTAIYLTQHIIYILNKNIKSYLLHTIFSTPLYIY